MSTQWRKSSYSAYNGSCVEVAWRKSSYCESGQCTEVAQQDGRVLVRDSKDPGGPVLAFSGAAWAQFVARVKAGQRAG